MLIAGYNIPDAFKAGFRRLAETYEAEAITIGQAAELNRVDPSKSKCIIAFHPDAGLLNSLILKAGSNSVIIVFEEMGNPAQLERSDLNLTGRLFRYSSRIGNSQFIHQAGTIIESRFLFGSMSEQDRLHARLNLIHEITRNALAIEREEQIRVYLMRRLFNFYKAENCAYLEYDDQGDIFLESSVNHADGYQTGLHEFIKNKNDYEECVQCGYPVVNCLKDKSGGLNYVCAPIIEDGQTRAMIRIGYLSDNVDITVDRTILRIIADILSFARMRDKTRDALKVSEQRATTVLDTTVDAIITIDSRGNIDSFNQAAENLFGYSADEVHGKNVKVLMPQPYKREHDRYIGNYLKSGEKKIIGIGREVTGRRKNGTVFPMYLAVSEYQVDGRRMFTGIIRDITEERRLEQEVMRISEHERHRIGQDLHDGLGQMLSGIGLLSRRLTRLLEQESHELAGDLKEISDLVQEADEYSRGLARGLIKIDLDKGGFVAAIEKLVRQSEKLFRIECTITAPEDVTIQERTTAEHLYRIIQEAINNSVKHGESTHVHVQITESPDFLRFSVTDNGTGFPKDWRSRQGLGVRIMEFRSRLIGAHFEQVNNENGGATITCTLSEN